MGEDDSCLILQLFWAYNSSANNHCNFQYGVYATTDTLKWYLTSLLSVCEILLTSLSFINQPMIQICIWKLRILSLTCCAGVIYVNIFWRCCWTTICWSCMCQYIWIWFSIRNKVYHWAVEKHKSAIKSFVIYWTRVTRVPFQYWKNHWQLLAVSVACCFYSCCRT